MPIQPFETRAERAAVDRVLSALSTGVRRSVLAYFAESPSQTASLEELAEYVTAREPASGTRSSHEVRLRLHHVALPTLADAGLVDYDARTGTVGSREDVPVEELGALLDVVEAQRTG